MVSPSTVGIAGVLLAGFALYDDRNRHPPALEGYFMLVLIIGLVLALYGFYQPVRDQIDDVIGNAKSGFSMKKYVHVR